MLSEVLHLLLGAATPEIEKLANSVSSATILLPTVLLPCASALELICSSEKMRFAGILKSAFSNPLAFKTPNLNLSSIEVMAASASQSMALP